MTDCRDCKDWHDCTAPPDWFHYGQIRWCPYQCIWIIAHSETLREGRWPPDPYRADNNNGQRNIKTEASFTKPILILAELETRLERAGIRGKLLVAQVEAGREINTLDREARDALMYVKGFRRKKMSFSTWKRQRNYRSNEYKNVFKLEKQVIT